MDLKPCPHCGGTDLQVDFNGVYERHFVRCYNFSCHMQGPEVYGREKSADAWNNLPRALVWSDENPKQEGWYILRKKESDKPIPERRRLWKEVFLCRADSVPAGALSLSDANESALTWTSETPTVPGWYFTRRNRPGKPLRVMYVKRERRYDHRVKKYQLFMTMANTRSEDGYIIEDLNQPDRLWAGPIPEPVKGE